MSRVPGGLFLPAVLLAFLLGPPVARADTFVFNDLSETPTVSGVGPSPVPCGISRAERCEFDIEPPAGAISVSGTFQVGISDPDGITASDEVSALESIPKLAVSAVAVAFFSDSEFFKEVPLCASLTGLRGPVGCALTETGAVQTAGTITWLGAGGAPVRTDTIEFASDITDVPEPASWLLVLTGLPLLGLRRWRRPPVGS
jgi:hypothetical protein